MCSEKGMSRFSECASLSMPNISVCSFGSGQMREKVYYDIDLLDHRGLCWMHVTQMEI